MTTTTTKLHTWVINCFGDVEGVTTTDDCYTDALLITTDLDPKQLDAAVKEVSEIINEHMASNITFEAFVDDDVNDDDQLTEAGITWCDGEQDTSQPAFFQRDVRILKRDLELRLGL